MNRRSKRLILLLPLLLIGLGALVIWDFYDRGLLDSSENYPEEKALFHQDKTMEEIQAAYEDNYKNPEYFFPRKEIKKTILYNNSLFSHFSFHSFLGLAFLRSLEGTYKLSLPR